MCSEQAVDLIVIVVDLGDQIVRQEQKQCFIKTVDVMLGLKLDPFALDPLKQEIDEPQRTKFTQWIALERKCFVGVVYLM